MLAIEINAAAENPLIADGEVLHHGGFHAATCALALDGLRLALVPFAGMSAARLTHLMAPEPDRAAAVPRGRARPGSSGVLIAEYLAADALGAAARRRGAGGARDRRDLARPGGARELRLAGRRPGASRRLPPAHRARAGVGGGGACAADEGRSDRRLLAPARALAEEFETRLEDRPIGADAGRAVAALPALAAVVRAAASE